MRPGGGSGLAVSFAILVGALLAGSLTRSNSFVSSGAGTASSAPSSPVRAAAEADDEPAASHAPERPSTSAALTRDAIPVHAGDTLVERAGLVVQRVPVTVSIAGFAAALPIVSVGIDRDGAFDLPPGSEVGWYRYGPMPGEKGSAVLAAHVDWNGAPGAFFGLADVRIGDLIEVRYDDDSTVVFSVTSIEQHHKSALPFDELFSREGAPRLALITCGGEFDRSARHYTDNVVVVADAVDSAAVEWFTPAR